MSKVFDAYAAYYDLLYRDKDYAGEAAYVDRIIQRHHPGASSMLELGCGTGGHALHLANHGYEVHGIDLSPSMIALAQERPADYCSSSPTFEVADLRKFRAARKFDAVVSLFHVMSYQILDSDLHAAMETAAVHMNAGGVFVFDCWFGPGVLADPPAQRFRKFSGGDISINRKTTVHHDLPSHRVDVTFEIEIQRDNSRSTIIELHSMRYLFTGEIENLLAAHGLRCVHATAWMRDDMGNGSPWYACFAATR